MTETIFVGLVTHPRTRFRDASTEFGLARSITRELEALGADVALSISDGDAYDPSILSLTKQEVLASIKAELQTEFDWRRFLDPSLAGSISRTAILKVEITARYLVRVFRFAPPWKRRLTSSDRGAQMLRRLLNIELSHRSLLQQALAQNRAWILILEDDAWADDPATLAASLLTVVQQRTGAEAPKYMNLSDSFSVEALVPRDQLSDVCPWGTTATVQASQRPFTNTVCAMLYRSEFAKDLLGEFARHAFTPVVPIDWKLNMALLNLYATGRIGVDECWSVVPGPIQQRSMLHGPPMGNHLHFGAEGMQ